MHRRTLLSLAAGTLAGLAGCTVRALPDGGSTPAPAPECPDLLDTDRTVCPHDAEEPLEVHRSAPSTAGPGWTLSVAVTNRAEEAYGCNPYAWSVFEHDDGRWERLAPDAWIEPWTELEPGATYTWLLSGAEGDRAGADQRIVLDLAPGTYAFAIALEGPSRIAAVAPFEVGG